MTKTSDKEEALRASFIQAVKDSWDVLVHPKYIETAKLQLRLINKDVNIKTNEYVPDDQWYAINPNSDFLPLGSNHRQTSRA